MTEKQPTPISEGALIKRERVLAMRERMERLNDRLDAKERDLLAEQKRLSMRAQDHIDWVIDENARLDEEINTVRQLRLELDKLMNESFDKGEELIDAFARLEQRLAEVDN